MRRDMNTGVRRLGRVVAGLWPGTLSVCAISGNPRASVSSFTMETVRDRPPEWETEKGLKGHLVSGGEEPEDRLRLSSSPPTGPGQWALSQEWRCGTCPSAAAGGAQAADDDPFRGSPGMLRAPLPAPLASERERERQRQRGTKEPQLAATWLLLCVGLGRSDQEQPGGWGHQGQPRPAGPGCGSRHPGPRQGHAQDSGCRCRCPDLPWRQDASQRGTGSDVLCHLLSLGWRLGGCRHALGRPRKGPLWPLTPLSLEAAGLAAATSHGGLPGAATSTPEGSRGRGPEQSRASAARSGHRLGATFPG